MIHIAYNQTFVLIMWFTYKVFMFFFNGNVVESNRALKKPFTFIKHNYML
jgi:hypothetical protein